MSESPLDELYRPRKKIEEKIFETLSSIEGILYRMLYLMEDPENGKEEGFSEESEEESEHCYDNGDAEVLIYDSLTKQTFYSNVNKIMDICITLRDYLKEHDGTIALSGWMTLLGEDPCYIDDSWKFTKDNSIDVAFYDLIEESDDESPYIVMQYKNKPIQQ